MAHERTDMERLNRWKRKILRGWGVYGPLVEQGIWVI
jgi:hypothetical protein